MNIPVIEIGLINRGGHRCISKNGKRLHELDSIGKASTKLRSKSFKSPPAPPSWSNISTRGVTYPKPQRTVKLLAEAPCFLSLCPSWIKSTSLWSPRLSPRLVDVQTLGWGRHGSQVLLVKQTSNNGSTMVLKQFSREKLLSSPRLHDKVLNEWLLHAALVPHPNIVPLYGAVEDKSYVTLLMEAQSGDLLRYLDRMDRETLTEDEARNVAADVLAALAHMHDLGFVHRDVKPENVFAAVPPRTTVGATAAIATDGLGGSHVYNRHRYSNSSGSRSRGLGGGSSSTPPPPPPPHHPPVAAVSPSWQNWRLGDFGSAVDLQAVMRPGAPGLNLEGSPPFLAPEYATLWLAGPACRTAQQLQRATSPKQDIWALGALVYDMLVGHPPFSGASADSAASEPPLPQLLADILTLLPSPSPAAAGLSAAAVDFITAALCKAPEERPSAVELLSHPWLVAPLVVEEHCDRSGDALRSQVMLPDSWPPAALPKPVDVLAPTLAPTLAPAAVDAAPAADADTPAIALVPRNPPPHAVAAPAAAPAAKVKAVRRKKPSDAKAVEIGVSVVSEPVAASACTAEILSSADGHCGDSKTSASTSTGARKSATKVRQGRPRTASKKDNEEVGAGSTECRQLAHVGTVVEGAVAASNPAGDTSVAMEASGCAAGCPVAPSASLATIGLSAAVAEEAAASASAAPCTGDLMSRSCSLGPATGAGAVDGHCGEQQVDGGVEVSSAPGVEQHHVSGRRKKGRSTASKAPGTTTKKGPATAAASAIAAAAVITTTTAAAAV